MGVVYRALCDRDDSVVALKSITPAVQASRDDLLRFAREADILKSLSHPSIVAFRDMGVSSGILYFAMEYVPGMDAAKLLKQLDRPLSVSRAVRLICQLLEALEYAHGEGFIHRDIKPANLLVVGEEPNEQIRLTDFGLARQYQASKLSGLTLMGDVAGTAPFMPPEQITNYRDAMPSVDQYASAATLYHLLTRQSLYDFPRDIGQQLMLILTKDPIPIGDRRADVPAELARIIHKGISRDPDDRYREVGAMRDALVSFDRHQPK